ncbi:MAG: orotidine-5'-phosphate decarboxylase [Acidobacteriota bacterium]|nr:orotidine-5'-phosphate decarboxylase [Acidobacteriota bacterium]OQB58327.1 MAG: Orotidine 5'-phosphate decarboxylase [Candidatus Aminicenantes bacterium ADurb.Bin147]HNQ80814.1 orotidine-5'-phosphate decarboxylase [Candidatus Aminicenantes bacterium]MDD8033674.1 orotidine-5'-phosphate decarboxylase [Acidobacteriota bacterium]MDD8038978.1 orotidine-5'-phosphate decarboxylase [Acidobacteriota bacterium]
MTPALAPSQRIITALDVENKAQALALVDQLGQASLFKIGLELFTAEGPALLREIQALGKGIFLDLKLHDIPNTVGEAARIGVRNGARMMTIHASGGKSMMARAAETAAEEADKRGFPRPVLLGVTILTSLQNEDLASVGMAPDTPAQVLRLAALARAAGLSGVVCSAKEIEIVRKETGPEFLIVTPGIRPAGASAQDQKRVMTPAEAVARGSDYLVIGRPITQAASPAAAFAAIVRELEAGL